MPTPPTKPRWRWLTQPGPQAELFAQVNLAFLALDITVAHEVNHFARWPEWIPVAMSVFGPCLLWIAVWIGGWMPLGLPGRRAAVARLLGLAVGWAAVLVGVTGLLLHLNSQFFASQTLKNLVYTAPFAAPLAYSGIGLLILLNRMVDWHTPQWAGWIIVLALGGFVGNFVLSLADHAANGFWNPAEWIPVIAAALAVGFLTIPLLTQVRQSYIAICLSLMVIEIFVAIAGQGYHIWADLHGPSPRWIDNFIYGAPAFAPLLFANLAILAAIGLWPMLKQENAPVRPEASPDGRSFPAGL